MQVEAKAGKKRTAGIREHVETLTFKADDDTEAKDLAELFWIVKDLGLEDTVKAVRAAWSVEGK